MELVVTRNFGNAESWTLESYRNAGGYQSLQRVLRDMTPEAVSYTHLTLPTILLV